MTLRPKHRPPASRAQPADALRDLGAKTGRSAVAVDTDAPPRDWRGLLERGSQRARRRVARREGGAFHARTCLTDLIDLTDLTERVRQRETQVRRR
jgi:NAD-dependent oxidoreductase involved in siderophore biosynthesis